MNKLVVLAVVLMLVWVVARVVLAITGVLLHLLWIAAIVVLAIWVIQKIGSKDK